ncbi:MAG: hypothetical protein NPIRA02_04550 [Nitrospirales bacterium]|nr:MAG: hypothetical protein NPIRA02_04550 [Nitrospirales bacterium]
MTESMSPKLRSPYEKLGRYILLPRIIDKVRLHTQGLLPTAYHNNLLKGGFTLDGQFLTWTGLDGSQLRETILNSECDDGVLAWVESKSAKKTEMEHAQWMKAFQTYRLSQMLARRFRKQYPEIPSHVDLTAMSLFDLIDMDEGRLPIPDAS